MCSDFAQQRAGGSGPREEGRGAGGALGGERDAEAGGSAEVSALGSAASLAALAAGAARSGCSGASHVRAKAALRRHECVPLCAAEIEAWLPRAAHLALGRYNASGIACCVMRSAGRAEGADDPRTRAGDFEVCRAFGFADAASGKLASHSETVFDAGSHSRLLTVLAALRLSQSGALKLDADINAFLPACLRIAPDERFEGAPPVTLRHLLTHTSGFGPASTNPREGGSGVTGAGSSSLARASGSVDAPSAAGAATQKPLTALVAFLSQCSGRRHSAPGVCFMDCDYNYLLIGAAIEAAEGTTFANVVAQSIFAPLRMSAALNCMGRAHVDALATSYVSAGSSAGVGLDPGVQSDGIAGADTAAGRPTAALSARSQLSSASQHVRDGAIRVTASDGSESLDRTRGNFWRPLGAVVDHSLESFSPVVGLLLTAKEMGVLGGALLESEASAAGTRRALLNDAAVDELRVLQCARADSACSSTMVAPGMQACSSSGLPLPANAGYQHRPNDGGAPYDEDDAGPLILHLRGARRAGADSVLVIVPSTGVLMWVATNTTTRKGGDEFRCKNKFDGSAQGDGSGEAGAPHGRRTGSLQQTNGRAAAPNQPTAATELAEEFLCRFVTPPPVSKWHRWFQVLPAACVDPLMHAYCFPYAGGSAPVMFEAWSSLLPDFINTTAVLLPGRGSRVKEPAFDSVRALACEIASALAPELFKRGPRSKAVFFGHGMGALLAYETARALKAKLDWSPIMLFVSGCGSPTSWCVNAFEEHSPPPERSERSRSPPVSRGRASPGLDKQLALHLLPDQELAEALRSSMRLPRHFRRNSLMLRAMMSTIRADVAAEETYRHDATPPSVRTRGEMSFVGEDAHDGVFDGGHDGSAVEGTHGKHGEGGEHAVADESSYLQQQQLSAPAMLRTPQTSVKLSCNIVAFAGTQDAQVTDSDIRGWQDVTTGTLTAHRVPGDHFYCDDMRSRERLCRSLAYAVAKHMSPALAPGFFAHNFTP